MYRVLLALFFVVLLTIPLGSCGQGPSTQDAGSESDKQKAAAEAEQATAQP